MAANSLPRARTSREPSYCGEPDSPERTRSLRARRDRRVLERKLRAHVEELALADRLAQGHEDRPRVPAGLGGRDALALGDAAQEVVERHRPGRAVAECVALTQRCVQLQRKPAD